MTSAQTRQRRRPPRAADRPRRLTRRRYLVRRATVLGSFLGVIALVYVVLFTSVFGVRGVEVFGTTVLTHDDVRKAAAVEAGSPLVRLDTDEIAARVAALPRVRSVDVRRSYPVTVRITLVERTPFAVITKPDGVHLVDVDGVDFGVVPVAPPGLPQLAAADPPTIKAAVTVLAAVPDPLRPQVASVSAETVGNVKITLADGRLVKWGSAEHSDRKAAVLGPLLTQPGKVYDVGTPDFPTIS
ncbi:cell division protein FtsQ/DivIB [Actinokineospora xionganensis]|uniref:FtsQ-type POTRA domain-containing protein n=1 Tax=Actinokineospora xionganensis TaxID=2684470 RepID=A0ABR7L4X0_9PSEU|nr:FtsQ-type POTRA domain-containing protein [Actinokineospora xionganensis]MBC6447699.1 FtsQ-type POTRA domain-containing protein [Actinokineospora xionganensis]